MSLILLLGAIGVFLIPFLKRPLINMVGMNHKFIYKLNEAKWFQNHWIAGMFLFVLNAVFFFLTILFLYLPMLSFIPFVVHLIVMVFAVVGSIYAWVFIDKAWKGTRRNRLKMGTVGSSFYMFLTIIFAFWLVNLKPTYPGEDTFMGAIGLVFAIFVTSVAFIVCFLITGFSKEINAN